MKHKALKIVHDEHQALGAMLQTLRILSSRLRETTDKLTFLSVSSKF